jgi:hypothetical protein
MEQIFLCYSHHDNEPITEGSRGWVTHFRQALEAEMKHVSRPCGVWMDPAIPGNRQFDQNIRDQLDTGAGLVIVYSENWLNSDYCRNEELQYFLSRHPDARDTGRLFLVKKEDVDIGLRPPELDKLNGYRFHQSRNQANPGVYLPLEPTDNPASEFRQELRRLAMDIKGTLKKTAVGAPSHSSRGPAPKAARKRRILLARATPDLLPYADRLSRELIQRGYEVSEPTQYRKGRANIESEWRELVADTDATIHLIGAQPDPLVDEAGAMLAWLQFELAGNLGRRLRLTWIAPHALAEGSPTLALASEIRDAEREAGDRLFQGIGEDTLAEIIDSLEEQVPRSSGQGIYLIYSQDDSESVLKLVDHLSFRNVPFEASLLSGNPDVLIADHIAKLSSAPGVLIYWGKSCDDWFSQKVNDVRRYVSPRIAHLAANRGSRIGCIGEPDDPQKHIIIKSYNNDFDMIYFTFQNAGFEKLDLQ